MLDIHAVSYQLVLTKIDKIKVPAREKVMQQVKDVTKTHAAAHPEVWLTSSEKRIGIAELQLELYRVMKTWN